MESFSFGHFPLEILYVLYCYDNHSLTISLSLAALVSYQKYAIKQPFNR